MSNSKRRLAMIRERMAAESLGWIAASKAIGTWWAENRIGQSPKREYYKEVPKNGT